MTWPTCLTRGQAYIPIPIVEGCPWCNGQVDPALLTESWRERRNRRRREATQARREAQ